MAEHLSDQEMDLYRRRQLPSHEALAVNGHLFSCAACRERFQGCLGEAGRWLDEPRWIDFSGERPVHDLVYKQIEAYVDNELSAEQRTLFDRHLATCELCAGEVSDLLVHKTLMAGEGAASKKRSVVRPPRTESKPDRN